MTATEFSANIAKLASVQDAQADPTALAEYYDQIYVKFFMEYASEQETIPSAIFKQFTDRIRGNFGRQWLESHTQRTEPILVQEILLLHHELSVLITMQDFTPAVSRYPAQPDSSATITKHIFKEEQLSIDLACKIASGQRLSEDEQYRIFKLGFLSALSHSNYERLVCDLCTNNPKFAERLEQESETYLRTNGFYEKTKTLKDKIKQAREKYDSAEPSEKVAIKELLIYGRAIPISD